MASSLPPVKNAAFTFDVCLVSQADTDIFKTSVTLAAGDITVSKDGGAFSNITTLPTEIGTSGVLPIALSATEMNADRVTVRFHDAAGDEWQDALVTIYTAAQTLDTTDGIADDIKATVNHADYGNAKLVRSTTPANTLTVDASHYVAGISGTKNTLDDLSGTDGDTLKTLSDQIDGVGGAAGSGAITWVYTLTNAIDATAIPDAEVWVTSDAGGLTVLASGRTNASGQVTFYLDAGQIYVWRTKSGWNFTNPDVEIVP